MALEPITRQEQLLSAIATGGDILSPVTREEMYLAYLAGDTSVALPEPITRKEQFLYQACLNGGGGTEITDGIVVKARDENSVPIEIDYYGGENIPSFMFGFNGYGNRCNPFSLCKKINWKSNIKTMASAVFLNSGLETLVIPETVETIGYSASGFAANSNALKRVDFLTSIAIDYIAFSSCTALEEVYAPNISAIRNVSGTESNNAYGAFKGCTALKNCEFGSVGKPVTSIVQNSFNGCTQDFLTITVYTTTAYKDTLLANIRNGATNATIIIKDSTTGETIVTSTP